MSIDYVDEFWNEKFAVALTRKQWIKVSLVLEREVEKIDKRLDRLHLSSLDMDGHGENVSCVQFCEEQIDAIKAFLSAYEAARKQDAAILE